LRSSEFRQVYDQGTRHTCSCFAAFCLVNGGPDFNGSKDPGARGPKVGFTTPRALGKAVVRNRIRRRLREAVRLELEFLSPEWSIVFNPRRKSFDCPFPDLRAEVKRLFQRGLRASSLAASTSTNT
jgi:ribonuclease P protein component